MPSTRPRTWWIVGELHTRYLSVQVKRAITAFELDEDGHWLARLACGHSQHVRHDPPLTQRPLLLSEAGRARLIGIELDCKVCDEERNVAVAGVAIV